MKRSALAALAVVAASLSLLPSAVRADDDEPQDKPATKLQTTIGSPLQDSIKVAGNTPSLGKLTISGTARGPKGVTGVKLALQEQTLGYLQKDGKWSNLTTDPDDGYVALEGVLTAPKQVTGTYTWKYTTSIDLPAGAFRIRAFSYKGTTAPDKDATPAQREFRAGRDALLWPYGANSFWNVPLGKHNTPDPANPGQFKNFTPFGMKAPTLKTLVAEEDQLFLTPNLPMSQWDPIVASSAGMALDTGAEVDNPTPRRCRSEFFTGFLELAEGDGSNSSDGLPPKYPISGLADYDTSVKRYTNSSTAIVMPDLTLRETQPLQLCADGKVTSKTSRPIHQLDSIRTGGVGPGVGSSPGGGAHGGASMTAFGGTIRWGEWVVGGNIPHATKIELSAQKWLTQANSASTPGVNYSGYRWPALTADSYWNSSDTTKGYGTQDLTGTRPEGAVMGALLALPYDFDIEKKLSTDAAKILARSMQTYGTYIVDDTLNRDVVQIAMEWSATGRVKTQVETEFQIKLEGKRSNANPPVTKQDKFFADMELIYSNLHIVEDNASLATAGGAGARMTSSAPGLVPLQPFS